MIGFAAILINVRLKWPAQKNPSERSKKLPSRLEGLASKIEALAAKDEDLLRHERRIWELREHAAAELHRVCRQFTTAVNEMLTHPEVRIDPAEYPDGAFHEDGPNLIQINVRGRLLQIKFEATPELVSTENFRIPYVMEGAVRGYNQELLERNTIDEQLIFYCLEGDLHHWRFFDARTYRSGPLDQDYLISQLEHLI